MLRCASIANHVAGAGQARGGIHEDRRVGGRAGCDVQTVRFYEREGLLEEPAREASGYRRYAERHLTRLDSFVTADRWTFRWRKCGSCWTSLPHRTQSCAQVNGLLDGHIALVKRACCRCGRSRSNRARCASPATATRRMLRHPRVVHGGGAGSRLRLPRGAAPSHCSVTARAACRRPRQRRPGRPRGCRPPGERLNTSSASLSGSDR